MQFPVVVASSLAVFLSASALGKAVTAARQDDLRERAAQDLRCAAEELRLVEISSTRTGVEGCGRQATYVWTRTATERSEWMPSASADEE